MDPEPKPYVPSGYAVCGEWSDETMGLLPGPTQDLLRGHTDEQAVQRGEVDYLWGGRGFACPAVTIEEARDLDGTLLEAGFERSDASWGLVYAIPGVAGSSVSGVAEIGLVPLLPDGTFSQCCPG